MRIFHWFLRRRRPSAADCRRCAADLVTCVTCEGSWHAARCGHCSLGLICPVHITFWA